MMVGFASHAPLLLRNEPCHVKRLELCLSLFAGLCNHTFSHEVWLVVNGQLPIEMLIVAFWHVKRKGLYIYLSHLLIPAIATSLVFGRSIDMTCVWLQNSPTSCPCDKKPSLTFTVPVTVCCGGCPFLIACHWSILYPHSPSSDLDSVR